MPPSERDDVRRIIGPTATRHGGAIVDAHELEQLRLERLTWIAALEVLAGEPDETDRVKARALLAELAAWDADA